MASVLVNLLNSQCKINDSPCLTTPVCTIVVIITDTDSNFINYLTDFAVRRH